MISWFAQELQLHMSQSNIMTQKGITNYKKKTEKYDTGIENIVSNLCA